MLKAIAVAGIALALGSAQVAFAQRRPATEAEALSYIYSAFLTQADAGVMGREVVLGPELQSVLALPASAQGAKVYQALIATTVRSTRCTPASASSSSSTTCRASASPSSGSSACPTPIRARWL
jgi:hypothetical protein